MRSIKRLLANVWEFVVGDDPPTALGVVIALALTALIADAAIAAWWVMPPAVIGLLALSVRRATREEHECRRSGSASSEDVGYGA